MAVVTGSAKQRIPKKIESSQQQQLPSTSSSASPRESTGTPAGPLEKSAKLHKRSRSGKSPFPSSRLENKCCCARWRSM